MRRKGKHLLKPQGGGFRGQVLPASHNYLNKHANLHEFEEFASAPGLC
jgi:hypothetical protein